MVTVTDKGIEVISKLINGVGTNHLTYLANGSGSGAEAVGNTALTTENTLYGSARAAATCTNESNTTAVWYKKWTASGGSITVREVGVFDDDGDPAGNMAIRHVYASNKVIDAGESIEITIKLAFARAA
jgi:hypothetical protein